MGAPGGKTTSGGLFSQVLLVTFLVSVSFAGQGSHAIFGMNQIMGDALKTQVEQVIRLALAEDVGSGDVTSSSVVPSETRASGKVVARENLVVAGVHFGKQVFETVSPNIVVNVKVEDGQAITPGTALMEVIGPAVEILVAERTALNLLQRLCGIATLTREFVKQLAGTKVSLLDTRKTTPGLRHLEKYAVKCGGGVNHRIGLWDMVLIKDNHLATLGNVANPVQEAIKRARSRYPALKIEVEADTLAQAVAAAEGGADIILLDNMSPAELREAVSKISGRSKTEASGGINLKTIRAVAESGVDFISCGAITHSARAVDIALDFEA